MKQKNILLETLRKKKNLTIQEMADQVGISKAYYWQLENNNRRLFYDIAVKIANVFGLKPDDIFYKETK